MKIKYLYGKYQFLADVINGNSGIRFSDLGHYSRLENEKMRDDEMQKTFLMNKNDVIIEINGYRLHPEEMACDPTISIAPRHCYCLCLSSKRNDSELYSDFKADTCIAIDVQELERRLAICCERFGGRIVGNEITYYNQYSWCGLEQSPEKLVFYKPDIFSKESEYRIVWFYPQNKAGFLFNGKTVPFRFENESSHIFFFHKTKSFITDCIIDVHRTSI